MSSLLNDPLHWRARAEEARALAETMEADPEAKERMLEVAVSYDRLAEVAAKREKREGP